jgi:hypothetical protein
VSFKKDTWENKHGYVMVYEHSTLLLTGTGYESREDAIRMKQKRWLGELNLFVPDEEFDINKYFPHLSGKALVAISTLERGDHGHTEFVGLGNIPSSLVWVNYS